VNIFVFCLEFRIYNFGFSRPEVEVVGERSKSSEVKSWGLVELLEVRMPAWVAYNLGENPRRRTPKVSAQTFVGSGLVGT